MKTITRDKIKRFKTRLLKQNASSLMKKGGKNLSPIATCYVGSDGKIIIPTDRILDFFSTSIYAEKSPSTPEHFSNLYTLFDVFTKDIDDYSFKSETKISEKDIQEANIRTTIEHLTRNLIISFFDNIRSEESGELVDATLLEKDLAKLIRISSSGRDYRSLVEKTLKELVETLKIEESWHKCTSDMNDAALVCSLVGSTLPKVESAVVSKFIQQARDEIRQNNQIFDKVLNTKKVLVETEPNIKVFLKSAKKLDLAIEQILDKLDRYFSFALNFIQLLGLPLDKFIGTEHDALIENLAKYFLGYNGSTPDLKYSEMRFRLDMMFKHPHLMICCKAFKDHKVYHPFYMHIFKLYYDELAAMLEQMTRQPEDAQSEKLAGCLARLEKIMEEMGPDPDSLKEEKQRVQNNFVSLILVLTSDQLSDFIPLRESLRNIVQDTDGRFLESIRKTLLKACYANLKTIDNKEMKQDDFQTTFQKIIFSYAVHYRPQRIFYLLLFESYVGKPGGPPSDSFQNRVKTDKKFALMVLKVLSDAKTLELLLPKNYLEYAGELLDSLQTEAS